MKKFFYLLMFLFCCSAFSQQLVYTPVNPNFGGNTFNYQWLLSSANAQNSFEGTGQANERQSELERFQESLNRQILGQLSRSAFTN